MPQAPVPSPWWKKLAWLALFWIAGVIALGLVAWLLRRFMQAAGLAGA